MIANLLLKLIDNKFYANKEDIASKCDIFFAMNKINADEYANLTLHIEEVYFVAIVEDVKVEDTNVENVEVEGEVA